MRHVHVLGLLGAALLIAAGSTGSATAAGGATHQHLAASHGVHVAFACASRAQVDAFHAAALTAGGRDNGAPGLRPWYHPDYYAAFVLDPDGNNIEAVCHRPVGEVAA